MSNSASKKTVSKPDLESKLLSTLDEGVFFKELYKVLSSVIKCDMIEVHQVFDDQSHKLIVKDGKINNKSKRHKSGEGTAAQVIRTKRAYFSNNIQRDPIFTGSDSLKNDFNCEMIIPAMSDGVMVSTIHFKRKSVEEGFDRASINKVLEIIQSIQAPLGNIRMFLAAKSLNDALLKKIEEKEKELSSRSIGLQTSENLKIKEPIIIFNSKAMNEVIDQIDKSATSNANILLHGEPGTGKEMLSKRVHCKGPNADKGFSIVDCSILTEEQLEAEIFGLETNDINKPIVKHGLLETCHSGTLAINNISKMSLRIQGLLESYLEEGIAFRKGGQVPYRSELKIVTISTKDLDEMAAEGKFKLELLLKLNTMKINVPALRDREDDVIVLSNHFLNEGKSLDLQKSLSPGAVSKLKEYSWPSNVRELQNVIERAYILSDGMIVDSSHLADFVVSNIAKQTAAAEQEEVEAFREMTLDELEKAHICKTLDHLGGNKTKTAKILGITVKTLYNKLHSYDMIASKDS